MVLYYNQGPPLIEKTIPADISHSDVQQAQHHLYTRDKNYNDIYPDNKGFLENFSNTIFGGTPELYSRLLEENFINLSTDEKLIFMYKSNIIQHKMYNNYLMIIMFFLIIIIYKLYFKKD